MAIVDSATQSGAFSHLSNGDNDTHLLIRITVRVKSHDDTGPCDQHFTVFK